MARIASLLSFLLLLGIISCQAQVLTPVKWSFSSEKVSENEFLLKIDARIDKEWAMYSQYLESEDGPLPTVVTFNESDEFVKEGKTTESENLKKSYDPVFEMNLQKFFDYATFTQKVKLTGTSAKITGDVYFMVCDKTRCLAPEFKDFEFELKAVAPEKLQNEDNQDQGSADKEDKIEQGTAASPREGEEKGIVAVDAVDDVPGDVVVDNAEKTLDIFSSVTGVEDQPEGMYDPVQWSFELKEVSENTFDAIFTAEIQEGWHIYTQFIDTSKIGPIPTTFYFTESDSYTLKGKATESAEEESESMDPFFDMVLKKLKKKAEFVQRLEVTDKTKLIEGEIEYMVCNANHCMPGPYATFSFDPQNPGKSVALVEESSFEVPADYTGIDQRIESVISTFEDPVGDCGQDDNQTKDKSLLVTFVLGFLGGLVALLTPCVFPMIPLTVSYFSKDTKRKGWWNGTIYGLSIIGIYVALGLIITATFGAAALNALSTNWIANTAFFLIFIAFALSFFGYYEITLPSSWANKSDSMADKGGLIGIFFMAATLAIVSFSCTGPIIGSALVQSATSTVGPFVVMLGFSTALALPFGLFAAFPAWLNSLPRSGSWMNSVKVFLGFIELALAFKFLSVADMTSHWGVLRYELFLGIWVILAVGLALYLFGKIRFPHDSPLKRLSIPRLTLALLISGIALYMATGFFISDKTKTYSSVPMLSGLAPPANYNFFIPPQPVDADIKSRFPSYSKCANNLNCFKDYTEGLTYAREVNKPLFVDFTGYGCVNCRKTEEHIWIRDEIWEKLSTDFVLVSLYVDDRADLPMPLYSIPRGEKLRNVGRKWTDFQIVNFEQNTQPLYVIMSTDEKVLAYPRGYDESVKEYNEYLECGLNVFNEQSQLLGSKE